MSVSRVFFSDWEREIKVAKNGGLVWGISPDLTYLGFE